MSEAGAGSAALAGNPGTGGDAGNPGVENPPGDTPEWFGKLPEQIRGMAEVKGWRDPDPSVAFAKMGESYKNLETLMGSNEKIALPKDDTDVAGWDKVWNRLGRPEKADGYGLDKIEGADPAYAKAMSEAFHKAGVTAKQAKMLAEAYGAYGKQQTDAARAAMDASGEAELQSFKNEMGARYDEAMEGARRVIKADGIPPEDLTALESVWGTGKMLRYFSKRAGEVLEHNGPSGELKPSMTMTPAGAKAKISEMWGDESFMKRYLSDDSKVRESAIAEMERVHKLSVGTAA